jgi:hypothetical protein
MKILYLIRAISHFTYHESTIRELCSDGHDVDVLFDRAWSRDDPGRAANAFADSNTSVSLGWSMRRTGLLRRPLFAARELLSYASYLNRSGQDQFYADRWSRYVPARRRFKNSKTLRNMLKSPAAVSALKTFNRLAPADGAIKTWLKESAYDAVVASPTNMRFSEYTDFIKAAKNLGIATIIQVLSWDNLTTKGLLHEVPDLTLAWNETQLKEAVEIHEIPSEQIVVTGSPFLDKWFKPDRPRIDDREFYQRMGLSLGEDYVLYLGSSKNIARDESWLVESLAKAFRDSDDERLRNLTVLVRPHGANQEIYEHLDSPNIKLKLREEQVPDSPDSFAEFDATLRHSVCVAGLNTTGMVDAIVSDRPVVALLVDEYANTNASRAVHFKYIIDAEVYEVAHTTEEAARIVGQILGGADEKREYRAKFTRDFVRPYGPEVSAGLAASTAITTAATGKNAMQVRDAIHALESEQKVAVT